jgi:NTP pyrophosphatase (non-canonical NTP hydrolase)
MARVNEILPQEEILAQLAEEAAELAQAALKLRRAMDALNPTPISVQEAGNRLAEEVADVIVCENQLFGLDWNVIDEICKRKLGRWEGRLEAIN